MFFLVFLSQLIFLAFLTRHSSAYFLDFFKSITGSEKLAIILFAVLFFPGTLIHELAHWLMATALLVHTGDIELLPERRGDSIKLGSVSIAQTDPIRRLLIGIAPIIVGLLILLGSLWYVTYAYQSFSQLPWWGWVILGYLVLVIASTLFSSRKDLEGAFSMLIAIIILSVILYFLGFGWVGIIIYKYLSTNLDTFFSQLALLMLIPISINSAVNLLGILAKKRWS